MILMKRKMMKLTKIQTLKSNNEPGLSLKTTDEDDFRNFMDDCIFDYEAGKLKAIYIAVVKESKPKKMVGEIKWT